jgi:hypothetical protein
MTSHISQFCDYCQVTQCAVTVFACYYELSDCIRHPHVLVPEGQAVAQDPALRALA